MLQLTPQMRILLAVAPADFRRGIDGLARLCRDALDSEPFSGTAFVFVNRRRTAVRVLVYDGQGFWLCTKRLSRGRFVWWPSASEGRVCQLAVHELQLLLWNGNPRAAAVMPDWKRVLAD